jgi:class 3 adenylate cyclase
MDGMPETKYTKSGDTHIAYQVSGDGPFDLVFVPGFVSHLEAQWEDPDSATMLRRLSGFSRLIRFDKRGTGLSDRGPIPTLEQRMDDVRAVMDAVGSERAALLGISEGGPMSLLFAATYPSRTRSLVLYGSYARRAWAPDHPVGRTTSDMEKLFGVMEREWGGPVGIETWAPSRVGDERYKRWWSNYLRQAASPGAAISVMRMNMEIDVRHVLSSIRVPTLILHRTGDRLTPVGQGRYLASKVPGAMYVELPGDDHSPFAGDMARLIDEVEEFLTGVRAGAEDNRILATVMFTDIVGATERAVAAGDSRWRDLLAQHHAAVRRELARFRGREIDTAGDGFLATFDGPARAVRCAARVVDAVTPLGLQIRAGLHTGECEMLGDKVSGIAVHVGARVAGLAGASEVLVSSTVKDLVAGSGLRFEPRGIQTLKGVPGEWPIFALAGDSPVTHPA